MLRLLAALTIILLSAQAAASAEALPRCPDPFIRGDTNGDTVIGITDPIMLLSYLYLDGPAPACLGRADANGDGSADLADAIFSLEFQLLAGPPPPSPFPTAAYEHIDDCPDSPCLVYLKNTPVLLQARQIVPEPDDGPDIDTWSAEARHFRTNQLLVTLDITLRYGIDMTHADLRYSHAELPYGEIADATAWPTVYDPENGVRLELSLTNALILVAQLYLADIPRQMSPLAGGVLAAPPNLGEPGSGNQQFPRPPNGCNYAPMSAIGPIPLPTWPAMTECCNCHDLCYARGGCEADRLKCDEELKQCMDEATPDILDWTSWIYRKIGPEGLINLFGKSAFRYHNESCVCNVACDSQSGNSGSTSQSRLGDAFVTESCTRTDPMCYDTCELTFFDLERGTTEETLYMCKPTLGGCYGTGGGGAPSN
jgi:hypothetical protein